MIKIFKKRKVVPNEQLIIHYEPSIIDFPDRLLPYDSAWRGLENIIKDIIVRFDVPTDQCLEFGVEFGYSTVAFANYFSKVTGVDIFTGDIHAGLHDNNYRAMIEKLKPYSNISLVKADYLDYIKDDKEQQQKYGLIHVDIIHNYKETFECGLWSANHSKVTIFHDTESFPEVKRAVLDIAKATGKTFYNYPRFFGLGILA